jgi:hypothetical protein
MYTQNSKWQLCGVIVASPVSNELRPGFDFGKKTIFTGVFVFISLKITKKLSRPQYQNISLDILLLI